MSLVSGSHLREHPHEIKVTLLAAYLHCREREITDILVALALPEWADVLTDADRRGLTPIFHTNMTPYGEVQIRTDRRLDLSGSVPAAEN